MAAKRYDVVITLKTEVSIVFVGDEELEERVRNNITEKQVAKFINHYFEKYGNIRDWKIAFSGYPDDEADIRCFALNIQTWDYITSKPRFKEAREQAEENLSEKFRLSN